MNRYLIAGGLALAAFLATERIRHLVERVHELEGVPRADPQEVLELRGRLEAISGELEATRATLEQDRARDVLRDRLTQLESELGRTGDELRDQDIRLSSWEERWEGSAPELYESRLQELRRAIEKRWRELDEIAVGAARTAQEDRSRLEFIDQELVPLMQRDEVQMWQQLVGPVVQLAGDSTVGSGVLLEPRALPGGEGYVTYLLTSWHVVRDIYGGPEHTDQPVPVKIYLQDGRRARESAKMLAYDVASDLALLELDTKRRIDCGARLASRERLGKVRVFDRVYAVGCPLGNDPIPTGGEVASTRHEVDGGTYWMISAPTYIGNSGGGIFDAETHELLGIFSKIYTHGSSRSTIVPHMGLVTPLSTIYDWLDRVGYAALETPAADLTAPKMAAAAQH
jgi:S1-C subfamily serine protease